MKDEALDKALNALLWANIEINDWRDEAHGHKPEDQPQIMEAITAIKQALAAQHEPENEPHVSLASVQEPVAWLVYAKGSRKYFTLTFDPNKVPEIYIGGEAVPLYTTLPAAPDLQAELDATNRQVEILSDALAESRREVAAIMQAITDPENQPSQFGTVTMAHMQREVAAQPAPVREPLGYVYEVHCLPECALEMEWVECFDRCEPDARANIRNVTPVYTTPPAAQRQWVGLTDDEMYLNCPNWLSHEQCKVWIQQIEAKLKEKNT